MVFNRIQVALSSLFKCVVWHRFLVFCWVMNRVYKCQLQLGNRVTFFHFWIRKTDHSLSKQSKKESHVSFFNSFCTLTTYRNEITIMEGSRHRIKDRRIKKCFWKICVCLDKIWIDECRVIGDRKMSGFFWLLLTFYEHPYRRTCRFASLLNSSIFGGIERHQRKDDEGHSLLSVPQSF